MASKILWLFTLLMGSMAIPEPFTITLDEYGANPTSNAYLRIEKNIVEKEIIEHVSLALRSQWYSSYDIHIDMRGHNDKSEIPSIHATLHYDETISLEECFLGLGSWFHFVNKYALHKGSNVTVQYKIILAAIIVTPQ